MNEELKAKVIALGIPPIHSIFIFNKKELAELNNVLMPKEEIFAITNGTFNKHMGILIATKKRLVFIDKGLFYGLKTQDFILDKILSIQFESSILSSSIKINASGSQAKIENVDKGIGKLFVDRVTLKLSEEKPTTQTVVVQQAQQSVADQLEKLANLKMQGLLTDDEFQSQKNKLLQ